MRKYTENGQEVEVIQELDDGRYLVAYVYYGASWGDAREYLGEEERIVSQLFDEAPAEKYCEKIDKLQREVEALCDRRRDIISELKEAESLHKERMAKYAKYNGLEQLDAFIAGKITHYVTEIRWSSPEIVTFEEMIGEDRHAARLLGLFGNSKGKLDWRLNRYRDDSGSWSDCIPCSSYDDAVEKLAGVMREKMKEGASQSAIDICGRYGIDVPNEYREAVESKRRASIEKAIAETRARLIELREKL